MGKLTDVKWWTGRTAEQRARRDEARAGMRKAKDDVAAKVRADVEQTRADWSETWQHAKDQSAGR